MSNWYKIASGYHGYSMSNNAVDAYNRGKAPLSKITTQMLIEAGWIYSRKLAMALAKKGEWQPSEWHHTSKYYNKTDFYDVDELMDIEDLEDTIISIMASEIIENKNAFASDVKKTFRGREKEALEYYRL